MHHDAEEDVHVHVDVNAVSRTGSDFLNRVAGPRSPF